jgi:hypothetical protein
MKYFVLKPRGTDLHAKASRRAMRSYAALIAYENADFAKELRDWADKEFADAIEAGMEAPEDMDRWGS